MIFGLGTETQRLGGDEYVVLTLGEQGVAGLMGPPPGMPDGVPAFWGVSFAVEDADATAALAVERGGDAADGADGRARASGGSPTVTDPWGASFSVAALSSAGRPRGAGALPRPRPSRRVAAPPGTTPGLAASTLGWIRTSGLRRRRAVLSPLSYKRS